MPAQAPFPDAKRSTWYRTSLRTVTVVVLLNLPYAVATSCSSTSEPATGDLLLDLRHRDPMVRVGAVIETERRGRVDLIAILVENLSHNDGPVRMFSGAALRRLSGRNFGYKPHGTPCERERAIERWQIWWREAGSKLSGTPGEISEPDSGYGERVLLGERVWN